jgi:hypothetical protein
VFVAERTVATVLLAAVILAPVPVDAVVLAVLVDVLLLALFLLEERHPRSVDDHDGHGHASA